MAKVPGFAKAFAGSWRIVEMDNWDDDFLDLVPLVHFGDPPAPGEGAGDARRAPGHVAAPISFGSRTRL